jgi:hypothetical protein
MKRSYGGHLVAIVTLTLLFPVLGTMQPLRMGGLVASVDRPPHGHVHALFDPSAPVGGPFPSDWFTVADSSHNTGRRVNLPLPDCETRRSDCEDIAVLNSLDGFNLQPRLSVPFSGSIDANSVTSDTVFLVSLGSTLSDQGYMPPGTVVGINQVVWDTFTTTLHIESNALLAQHTRFALIVTRGVRDDDGAPVEASEAFRRFRQIVRGEYKQALLAAIHLARHVGVRERDIAVAACFSTQSATAVLEKMRDQIHATTPEPADFLLGPHGERTVFSLEGVTGIRFDQQTTVDPAVFTPANLNLSLIRDTFPGAVGSLAFGKYLSPDYQVHPGEYPPVRDAHRARRPCKVNGSTSTLFDADRLTRGRWVARGDFRPPQWRLQGETRPCPSPARWRRRASPPSPSTRSGTASARSAR